LFNSRRMTVLYGADKSEGWITEDFKRRFGRTPDIIMSPEKTDFYRAGWVTKQELAKEE